MPYSTGSSSPGNRILDIRAIIDRYEELKDQHEANKTLDEGDPLTEDEVVEMDSLSAFLDDVAGYGGDHEYAGTWYPCEFILDSHFEAYAEQYAEDIGAVERNAAWPACHIDWEAAATSLKQDFSSVDWEGHTYWYRG